MGSLKPENVLQRASEIEVGALIVYYSIIHNIDCVFKYCYLFKTKQRCLWLNGKKRNSASI